MNPSQQRIYDFIEDKFVRDIEANKDNRFKKNLVKARLIRLMQAATNPELLKQPLSAFAEEESLDLRDIEEDSEIIRSVIEYHNTETPAKFEAALQIINDIISNKSFILLR